MDNLDEEKILKKYLPMTETAAYILFSFMEVRHGYDVIQHVEKLTNGRIKLGAGTMYGTITKLERDGIIQFLYEDQKRKYYQITDIGRYILQQEARRIKELYHNLGGGAWEEQ
ncbi:PadR family transcriptional regulator [Cytobacillus gottheilii]|uniref:PadR family transcriptional regulator n=1 Tax=Cytobacillus gottheilii TaxID=859144 RepID=UPI003CE6FBD5